MTSSVTLIFDDEAAKREFMNQLSDGWGENYVNLSWPWQHYWVVERYDEQPQQWTLSDGGFRHGTFKHAEARLRMLQTWNPTLTFRVTEIAPLFDGQAEFGVTLFKEDDDLDDGYEAHTGGI